MIKMREGPSCRHLIQPNLYIILSHQTTTTLNYFLSYKFNIQLKARKVAVPSTPSPTHIECVRTSLQKRRSDIPVENSWCCFSTYMRKVFPFFARTCSGRENDDMATVFSVVSLLLFKSSDSYARMEWTCNWKFHINEFHEISQMFTVKSRKKTRDGKSRWEKLFSTYYSSLPWNPECAMFIFHHWKFINIPERFLLHFMREELNFKSIFAPHASSARRFSTSSIKQFSAPFFTARYLTFAIQTMSLMTAFADAG